MYTSRIVGVGQYHGNPIVSFTLASKSIPFRELRINERKKRINVFPKKGYKDHPMNQDPEVDQYSCIRAGVFGDPSQAYLVTFNGHMAKRVEANIKEGMDPLTALDLVLLCFRGAPNDARIGGVSFLNSNDSVISYLGSHDAEQDEKRVKGYHADEGDLENELLFIYNKNTTFEQHHQFATVVSHPDEIAEYLHHQIIGEPIQFGVATGIALLRDSNISLGVYNLDFDQHKIVEWENML